MSLRKPGSMWISNRAAWRLKYFFILVIASSLGGPVYVTLFDSSVGTTSLWPTMSNGLIGGGLIWGFELLFVPSRRGEFIRRLSFIPAMALRFCIVIVVIIIAGPLGVLLSGGDFDPLVSLRVGPPLFIFVFGVVFILFAVSQIVRAIGPRVLGNMLIGRYQRPVREERVFMFLDIKGSTPLSEQLGDLGVQELIAQFFFDITEPILEWGGEVHRYIGDEVVVTWFSKDGIKDASCLQCCFAIQDRIKERAGMYREKFGVVPEFRIGLHEGPVVAAQCGDIKQEIVYFGDTINTTARIEQYCKTVDKPLLISAKLYYKLPANSDWHISNVGSVALRGRHEELELLAINTV